MPFFPSLLWAAPVYDSSRQVGKRKRKRDQFRNLIRDFTFNSHCGVTFMVTLYCHASLLKPSPGFDRSVRMWDLSPLVLGKKEKNTVIHAEKDTGKENTEEKKEMKEGKDDKSDMLTRAEQHERAQRFGKSVWTWTEGWPGCGPVYCVAASPSASFCVCGTAKGRGGIRLLVRLSRSVLSSPV